MAAGLRLSGFYAAYFAIVGVTQPYWPVWLGAQGLGPREIGLLLGSVIWLKVLANPLLAQAADRRRARRPFMLALAAAAVAGYLGFALADGFWWFLGLSLLVGVAFTAMLPMGDAVVLARVYERRLDYGRVRLWGSVAFIVTAVGLGYVIGAFGEGAILAAILLLLLGVGLAITRLPETKSDLQHGEAGGIRYLLAQPPFLLFILTTGLIMASHAVLTGFASIHWRAAGIADGAIGWLWSLGVATEIALFSFSNRVVGRLGVVNLMRLAAAGAVLRWLIMGFTAWLPALLLAQALHGLTFGAAHLAAMHFIARAVPQGMTATAQSLNAAFGGGIAMGLAMTLSGWLYGSFGAAAFDVMAILAALGLAGALLLGRVWNGGRF
jgi:MFS transporter, PPP family, 3-phenylpropionic acid transporter